MSENNSKRFGFFSRSTALLLALLLIVSAFVVTGATFSVRAATTLSAGDYVYVSNMDVSNSSITGVRCHMYTGNNDGSYIDSIEMQKVSENVWRCFLLGSAKYLKFKFNNKNNEWPDWWLNNNGNQWYSTSNIGGNCLYIKNENGGYGWADWGSINSIDPDINMTADNASRSKETTAVNGSTMSASNLELVKATFYDYYNNDETRGGWINGLDGSERSYMDREPFTYFNNKIAQYSASNSGWKYPLYFGDFNRTSPNPGYWYDDYKGAGASNLNKYSARANNSNATSGGVNGVVSGLVDTSLNNGKLTSNGVVLPYFDSSAGSIIKQGYGAVVNSDFAFRKETRNKDTYYVYDSTGGKDNFNFTNLSGTPVANYYSNSNSIYDAASGFGGVSNGKGFFPFDEAGKDAKDFGFGMRMEIPFRLNAGGTTKSGNDVVFNFAGDDDLWVFVDGKLVLDMGGAHKMATGSINFTKHTVNVNSVDSSFGNTLSDCTNNLRSIEYGKTHKMTVFYMERGMVESNLKVEYNFDPLGSNALSTESLVDKVDINSGISSYFPQADEFGIDIKDETRSNNIKNYVQSESEIVDNKEIVSSDQTSTGNKVGDTLNVAQTINTDTKLKYSTSYTVTDVINDSQVTSGRGSAASFKFQNTQGSVDDTANFHVQFVNTPQIGNLTISKAFYDKSNNLISGSNSQNKSFDMQILLDLDGNGNYQAYNLDSSMGVKAGGRFSLRGGESITFSNIPAGVRYRVSETIGNDFTEDNNGSISGTVTQGENSNGFTNRLKSAKLTVAKTFKDANGNIITGSDSQNREFSFTVEFNDHGTKTTNSFTLKGGESKVFTNLTVGTTYTVTEAGGADFTTTSTGASGTITSDGNTATFVNQISTTDLTIGKTYYDIDGSEISGDNNNKEFNFTLTLDSDSSLSYVKSNGESGDAYVTSSGYSFTLKGGETIIFGNVPIGVRYKVSEASSADGSYTTAFQNESGTVKAGGNKVKFENTRAKTDLTVTKTYYDIDNKTTITGNDPANEEFSFALWLNRSNNDLDYIELNSQPLAFTKTTANGTEEGVLNTGSFTLRGGEQIVFHDLPVGGCWYVVEDAANANGKYTCDNTGIYDALNASGNRADFVNRRQSTSITVSKTYYDSNAANTKLDGKGNFDFTLTFTNAVGTSFAQRYKELDTSKGKIKLNGAAASFSLTGGETITFNNLPIGAAYTVTEAKGNGFIVVGDGEKSGTTKVGGTTEAFTNKRVDASDINLTVEGTKLVEGNVPNDNEKFTFLLTPVDENGNAIGEPVSAQNNGSKFSFNLNYKFDDIPVSPEDDYSTFYYEISEQTGSDSAFVKYDTVKYYVGVNIEKTETQISLSDFYYSATIEDAVIMSIMPAEKVVFNNTYNTGKVTVNKADQSNTNVADTRFALVKVSSDKALDSESALNNVLGDIAQNNTSRFMSGATDSNGNLVFDNLVLFKDGTGEYSENGWTTNTWAYQAQTYCVFEYSPSQGYNPTMTKYYFTLPKDGKYEVTLDYVDGAVLVPASGGNGVSGWLFTGVSIMGSAMIMCAAYILYSRTHQKKRRTRYISD